MIRASILGSIKIVRSCVANIVMLAMVEMTRVCERRETCLKIWKKSRTVFRLPAPLLYPAWWVRDETKTDVTLLVTCLAAVRTVPRGALLIDIL
jgi:hypothetical protein